MMFDIFWKRKPRTTLNDVDRWFNEQIAKKTDELERIRKYLEPFASVGSTLRGKTTDSTVELAAQAHGLLKAGSATMKQQAREIEQLTEQLDASNVVNLQFQLDEANERVEVWKDRAQHWQAECDALRQQQIMLTTTTPTNVKPKGKPRTTGAKP